MNRQSLTAGLGIAAVSFGIAACSSFITYAERDLPATEVASFACYSRYYFVYLESCRVQAVDGLRPALSEMFGNTAKMLPGHHWIEVAFESYFGGGGGTTHVCAFDIDVRPGHLYRVKAHSLTIDIEHLGKDGYLGLYGGSLALETETPETSSNGQVQQVPVTCSFAGGSLCRKDADCVPHPDIRCFPQEGFPFGACRFTNAH